MLCIGHLKLLFGFVRSGSVGIQQRALDVVSLSAANQECVADIAASHVLVALFLLASERPSCPLLFSPLLTLFIAFHLQALVRCWRHFWRCLLTDRL